MKTKRKFDDLIRRWKANEISLVDAANELHNLGVFKFEQAWKYLERV